MTTNSRYKKKLYFFQVPPTSRLVWWHSSKELTKNVFALLSHSGLKSTFLKKFSTLLKSKAHALGLLHPKNYKKC